MKYCLSILAGILFTSAAFAGQWYAGVDVGYIEHEYTPVYSFEYDRADTSFANTGDGTEVGFYGGCLQELNKYLALACQARFAVNNAQWELRLDEPASFKYEQPSMWSLSLIPVISITEKLSLTFEAGLMQGVIDEKKAASPVSLYDVSKISSGTVVGAGLGYKLTDNIEVHIKYRHVEFDGLSYKAYLPTGEHVETIHDDPTAESLSLGISRLF